MKPILLCGPHPFARQNPEATAPRARAGAMVVAILRSLAVLTAALREIFDESAYQRFLDRSCLQSSAKAYAIFLKENEHARSRRPRCC
jgi:hypothetical protein